MFLLNCVICCLIASTGPEHATQGAGSPATARKRPATAKKSRALPRGSVRVAVLDVDRVIEQSKWVEWLGRSAPLEFRALTKKINEMRARHKALLDKADILVKDSTDYGMTVAAIKGLETEITSALTVRSRQMNKKRAESMVAIFHEIKQTVDRYARQQGIVLVLKKSTIKSVTKGRLQEELARIQAMSVIFAADSLDITKSIVELLDAAHPKDVQAAKDAAKDADKAAKEANGQKPSSGAAVDPGNGKKK